MPERDKNLLLLLALKIDIKILEYLHEEKYFIVLEDSSFFIK